MIRPQLPSVVSLEQRQFVRTDVTMCCQHACIPSVQLIIGAAGMCRGEGWGRPHVEAMSMALPGMCCLMTCCFLQEADVAYSSS